MNKRITTLIVPVLIAATAATAPAQFGRFLIRGAAARGAFRGMRGFSRGGFGAKPKIGRSIKPKVGTAKPKFSGAKPKFNGSKPKFNGSKPRFGGKPRPGAKSRFAGKPRAGAKSKVGGRTRPGGKSRVGGKTRPGAKSKLGGNRKARPTTNGRSTRSGISKKRGLSTRRRATTSRGRSSRHRPNQRRASSGQHKQTGSRTTKTKLNRSRTGTKSRSTVSRNKTARHRSTRRQPSSSRSRQSKLRSKTTSRRSTKFKSTKSKRSSQRGTTRPAARSTRSSRSNSRTQANTYKRKGSSKFRPRKKPGPSSIKKFSPRSSGGTTRRSMRGVRKKPLTPKTSNGSRNLRTKARATKGRPPMKGSTKFAQRHRRAVRKPAVMRSKTSTGNRSRYGQPSRTRKPAAHSSGRSQTARRTNAQRNRPRTGQRKPPVSGRSYAKTSRGKRAMKPSNKFKSRTVAKKRNSSKHVARNRRSTSGRPTKSKIAARKSAARKPNARQPSQQKTNPAMEKRLAKYKQWKARKGITGKPTSKQFSNFSRAHRPRSKGETFYARSGYKRSGVGRARPGKKWQKSEKDVTHALKHNKNRSTTNQAGFYKGQTRVNGRSAKSVKGSTKPDNYQVGRNGKRYAYEVKRYDVSTAAKRRKLTKVVSEQVRHRARHLPKGTRQQVIIDLRGQNLTKAQRASLKADIVKSSGGVLKPGQVSLMTRFNPKLK